jgi:hypothetical protein
MIAKIVLLLAIACRADDPPDPISIPITLNNTDNTRYTLSSFVWGEETWQDAGAPLTEIDLTSTNTTVTSKWCTNCDPKFFDPDASPSYI